MERAVEHPMHEIAGVGTWIWYPNEDRSYWSAEARQIYGLSQEAADGGDPRHFADTLHPDDRDEVIRLSWEAFRAGRSSTREFRIRPRDGLRWVREQADVELDDAGRPWRMIGVVLDVTDRKRFEAELMDKATAFERAHELARLGSFTIDLVGRRLTASREASTLLGLQEAFTIGINEFRERFVGTNVRDSWAERLDDAYRNIRDVSFEEELVRADGSPLLARIGVRVEADEFGRPARGIGIIQDVTEQRRLEEQVRQTQKMQAVGQLASGIAHDFNNLLLVIGGNAQLALVRGCEDARTELEEISTAAERAGDLVRSLLSFSRKDDSQPHNVELNEIARRARRMLDRLLEASIEIVTELTTGDTTVHVDPSRLEQALLNLAVNARDAMPGGGTLTIRTECVGNAVVLSVADDGVGMDDATRARIFEPFFTTKEAGDGTGLGLATVYAAVTESNGDIEVSSAPGRGSTFRIELPRATPDPAESRHIEIRPLVEGAGERILLVEDDPMVRAVSSELLTRAGYEIEAAENGLEAIRLLEEGGSFDAIVSDLMMPKMTGVQLAEELARRGIELPIVYTSGYAEHEPVISEPGRTRFVAKPFTGEQVTAAVSELLRP